MHKCRIIIFLQCCEELRVVIDELEHANLVFRSAAESPFLHLLRTLAARYVHLIIKNIYRTRIGDGNAQSPHKASRAWSSGSAGTCQCNYFISLMHWCTIPDS